MSVKNSEEAEQGLNIFGVVSGSFSNILFHFSFRISCSWWTFRPRKKKNYPPPPQKNSPIRRRHPPGSLAPPALTPPLLGFSIKKTDPPNHPRRLRLPLPPPPGRKKKENSKRPPSFGMKNFLGNFVLRRCQPIGAEKRGYYERGLFLLGESLESLKNLEFTSLESPENGPF